MLPDGGRVPRGRGSIPFDHEGAPCTDGRYHRHWSGTAGLKDPRRPASLMHAYIVVSLMAGVRPEEARAIGWEEDVDLDGNPPSVAVLRADRAGGDTKTPRSRRALKLAQMAVGALREWQVDQAAEREAAGSHWQDTGRVFTTATGTPLGARHIRKMFQDVCERAGFGRDWAPRDLRHTFVSLLSDDGMAIEKIARLAGHASSHVTETVYRQELRPVLQEGAEVMDRIFRSVNGEIPDVVPEKSARRELGVSRERRRHPEHRVPTDPPIENDGRRDSGERVGVFATVAQPMNKCGFPSQCGEILFTPRRSLVRSQYRPPGQPLC